MTPTLQARKDPFRDNEPGPEVASFHHLGDAPLAGRPCSGTACFVARHLRPDCWTAAEHEPHPVVCAGMCFAAPARVGDPARPRVEIHSRAGVVLNRLARGSARTLQEYRAQEGYVALEQALRQPPEAILAAVEASGLRGRGGAGFPTGRKWRAAAQQPAGEKFIVANADEGDAGAYIDRFLMEEDPHALIEGMLLAARAVGASRGWIYVRAEYPQAVERLDAALAEARTAGWLGEAICGHAFAFDIGIDVGRGSYVCGEETALIRSLEGRRPEVMARPPYATENGLWHRPTVINNVETLATVPWIVAHGGEAYRAMGFCQSRGTKVVSLNSLFQRPGLYEIEFGTRIRTIVEELGGGLRDGHLRGVIIGGPLAGILPPWRLDTRLGFEELRAEGAAMGHGGMIALDDRTSMASLVRHVFAFGAAESCGKCTPCRLGSREIERIFTEPLHKGAVEGWEEARFTRLVSLLRNTSLCGHGTGLGEFAASVLRHYAKELEPCFK